MTSEAKRRWLTVAAVAASTGLIVVLLVLSRRWEQDRRLLEEKLLEESYEDLSGEELSHAVYLDAAGLADATAEPPLSQEQRDALRKKFLETARSQRRQLERLYLIVLCKLVEGDPRYVAAVEGRSGWPYDQFDIDFRAFQHQRAQYEQALNEEDREIDARLLDMENQMQKVLSNLDDQRQAFPEVEKNLREKLIEIDEALQTAQTVSSQATETPGPTVQE